MEINETINVVASFGGPEKLRPVRFQWGSLTREVREVTYRWETREGASRIYHFAVTDGANSYELSFNSASLIWSLENTE